MTANMDNSAQDVRTALASTPAVPPTNAPAQTNIPVIPLQPVVANNSGISLVTKSISYIFFFIISAFISYSSNVNKQSSVRILYAVIAGMVGPIYLILKGFCYFLMCSKCSEIKNIVQEIQKY
jgi:hypothetical protein